MSAAPRMAGGTRDGSFARLCVKVLSRASRNALVGRREGVYRLRVTAAPVEGRANAAIKAFLAKCLGVPKASIRIVAGETSRTKTLVIEGLSQAEADALLEPLMSREKVGGPSEGM